MTLMASMDTNTLNAALGLFTKVSGLMLGMLSLIFTMRVSLMVIGLASAYEFGGLLKDTVALLGLNILFPKLVTLLFSLTASLASKIAFIPSNENQERINTFFTTVFESNTAAWLFGKVGYIAVDAMAISFYTISIGLLLAIAPIVLFLNLMVGLSHGTRAFFGVLISLSLWPVLWNLIGKLGSELALSFTETPIRTICFWVVIQIIQIFSPLFAVALFRSLSSTNVIPQIASLARKI